MKKLAEIITAQDVETILETVHAMVALVEKNGTLVSWNSAFESCKKNFPLTNNLEGLFLEKDKSVLAEKLSAGTSNSWVVEFPIGEEGAATLCDCQLVPTPARRMIFIAERLYSDDAVQMGVDKLSRQVKLFQVESEFTKKLARNKQVELDAVVAQAQEVAQTDPLTFLFNRRAITRELQDEVLRAERYGTMLSVSILDVDHFKSVNDTYGHAVGDEVLRRVAHRLRDGIRHPDVVGRYGGEEFIILLPNSSLQAAGEQADRLCRRVREMVIQVKEHAVKVTLSIGVAQLKIGEDTWDSLLNRADTAMYEAKKRGRNCWVAVDRNA